MQSIAFGARVQETKGPKFGLLDFWRREIFSAWNAHNKAKEKPLPSFGPFFVAKIQPEIIIIPNLIVFQPSIERPFTLIVFRFCKCFEFFNCFVDVPKISSWLYPHAGHDRIGKPFANDSFSSQCRCCLLSLARRTQIRKIGKTAKTHLIAFYFFFSCSSLLHPAPFQVESNPCMASKNQKAFIVTCPTKADSFPHQMLANISFVSVTILVFVVWLDGAALRLLCQDWKFKWMNESLRWGLNPRPSVFRTDAVE